jgi:hypothetical protein
VIHTLNPVDLLYDLAEASGTIIRSSNLVDTYGAAVGTLIKIGALASGPPFQTVICRACDRDHAEVVEFEPATGRSFYICQSAGVVTVDNADLLSVVFDPEWLVDWLASALPISAPVRWRVLVPGLIWYLGATACGDALVTVVFARRVSSQAALDLLVSALRPFHPTGAGLVVTTSRHVARQVQLPNGFEFLDLGEIIRRVGDQLIVDPAIFDSRVKGSQGARPRPIRGSRRGRKEPRRLDYREADKPIIAEMHAMILVGKARNPTDAARALASRATGSGSEASKVTRLAAGHIKVHPGA